MKKPKPVNKHVVCSECGLPWEDHKATNAKDPTLEECVRLLKAELAKPRVQWGYTGGMTTTYPNSSTPLNLSL